MEFFELILSFCSRSARPPPSRSLWRWLRTPGRMTTLGTAPAASSEPLAPLLVGSSLGGRAYIGGRHCNVADQSRHRCAPLLLLAAGPPQAH
eukprot:4864615-Pyramimonas_sp.AAC.1